MKKKKPKAATLDPDQAYRIRWRGVRLAKNCYRGFCSRCGAHTIHPTEVEARQMDRLCDYCEADDDVARGVAQVMAENARRSGGPYGPHDDESPWQSNVIRQLEDADDLT